MTAETPEIVSSAGALGSAELIARLRAVRQHLGLSQAEVAARAGFSRIKIAQIEVGRRADLGIDELIAICGALGIAPLQALSTEPLVVQAAVTV